MKNSFAKIIQSILSPLPKGDYPVLNTRLFVECWLGFILDQSLSSMRDLCFRVNFPNRQMDISTFSKASKQRSQRPFLEIYEKLVRRVNQNKPTDEIRFVPIDATIITLTSKLLWGQGFTEVKLISGLDLDSEGTTDNIVNFGKKHDINFGPELVASLPPKAVAIMDRGFASLGFMAQMERENKYFIVRVNQNYTLSFIEGSELFKVGTGEEAGEYRVVNFCSLESRKEYRLVTNLPLSGEGALTALEIAEAYRKRWQIELFWKFLKMHLKLDGLITKNVNGICIQIYASLIVYLILKLVEIPQEFGSKLIDKLRYLQACMCQEISFVHWMDKVMKC